MCLRPTNCCGRHIFPVLLDVITDNCFYSTKHNNKDGRIPTLIIAVQYNKQLVHLCVYLPLNKQNIVVNQQNIAETLSEIFTQIWLAICILELAVASLLSYSSHDIMNNKYINCMTIIFHYDHVFAKFCMSYN